MTSVIQSSNSGHQWTNFEIHTLLCLMIRGLHRENFTRVRRRSGETSDRAREHAHLEVATALNHAVHGADYSKDISKREVSRMIDQILEERKTIMGFNGYMERATRGRITRGFKRMWDRTTRFDYSGTREEWRLGRRAKEMEKYNISRGLLPLDGSSGDTSEDKGEGVNEEMEGMVVGIWKDADNAAAANAINWTSTKPATPFNTKELFPTFKDWNSANNKLSVSDKNNRLPN